MAEDDVLVNIRGRPRCDASGVPAVHLRGSRDRRIVGPRSTGATEGVTMPTHEVQLASGTLKLQTESGMRTFGMDRGGRAIGG